MVFDAQWNPIFGKENYRILVIQAAILLRLRNNPFVKFPASGSPRFPRISSTLKAGMTNNVKA